MVTKREATVDDLYGVEGKAELGPKAERVLAAKRADYFAAGTQVVWDVNAKPLVVRVYRVREQILFTMGRR